MSSNAFNLLEMRKTVVKATGRYDLIENTSTWADNGANYFISAGVDYLDLLVPTPENDRSDLIAVAAGENIITVPGCRAISTVSVSGSGKHLRRKTRNYVQSLVDCADYSNSEPTMFAPIGWNNSGEGVTNRMSRTILLFPTTDKDITLHVTGRFYSSPLLSDTDTNYWFINYPNLVLLATMREMEIANRNLGGVERIERTLTNFVYKILSGLALENSELLRLLDTDQEV